ncbi:uncharacterized protein DUF2852 [Palleronia aestuarii]|uniref:Uncharacterized protein DUF2852 n=1 Tax=Palleronia aestuarii TaxID=568105 RepID=A0A2W7NF29_9RHOB|nr:DUF2852 domain-containing protein [Palleronia aestuarii]PZX18520.1 uncharacterized protein DUF2852 [Palleronia aestuarii]
MTSFADIPASRPGPIARTEAWLDARGKPAWLALMVVGFILFWPVGLAVLGYMLWTRKLTGDGPALGRGSFMSRRSTGNAAFDAYRADTLHRLEEEQQAFESFLKRLREAKDKAEFDQFMADRDRSGGSEMRSNT